MAADQNPSASTKLTGETEVLRLPSQWPGAFNAYKHSKQAVKLNLSTFASWLLIEILISGGVSIIGNSGSGVASKCLFNTIGYILALLFSAIIVKLLVDSVRRQRVSVGDAFSRGLPFWFNNIILSILVGITLIASFLLLIVPFFFVWPRLALATYFLVDKNLSPVEAYKASWNATKGYVGYIYGILGAQIAMGLLMVTIIGIPFAIYFLVMYSAVHAVLYEMITKSAVSTPKTPTEA